jgi:Pyruvate/2-oxoacid:ferredoxin oxidoreductase delta subunit
MCSEVYKNLLEVMKKRGGRYAGMDIPEFYDLVEELFAPEEAEVNNALTSKFAMASEIAKGMGKNETEIEAILEAMANKGLCMALKRDGRQYYQAAPFLFGILEYIFYRGGATDRDKRLARLILAYKKAYDGVTGPAQINFPTSRVITVDRTIETGAAFHTYSQVQTYIDKFYPVSVGTCYCRHVAKLNGEDIHGMPMDVCMFFGQTAEFAIERLGARALSKKEARDVLDQAEEAGLVHMCHNTTDDIRFLCNCDRWHCSAIKRVLAQPKPGLLFNSGFEPKFDPDECSTCETCIGRCPPEALTMGEDDMPKVDFNRCFGCAVCATGCPSEAITMIAKEGFPKPPRDMKALSEAIKASLI